MADIPMTLLIVSGPMRSGTTLLGNMLHGGATPRHPEISFAPDTFTELREVTTAVAATVGDAAPLMNPEPSESFTRAWVERASEIMPAFRRRVLEEVPAANPRVFGVKLTCLLPELVALQTMPEIATKVIVIYRDSRDVFASGLKRYGDVEEAPHFAFMNASFALDYATMKLQNSMSVFYEDLVADPSGTMQRVLVFIGVDPASYDWPALKSGLQNNSSYEGVGPNGAVSGVGIVPSIGRHREVSGFYLHALSEVFSVGERPPLLARLRIYEEFLPKVLSAGERYGYRMRGLRRVMEKRAGILVPAVLGAKRLTARLIGQFRLVSKLRRR